MIRRVFPYLFLIALSLWLYGLSRDTREDIKVEYGHKNLDEPYRVELEKYTNRYVCNDCDMMIKSYEHSAQVIHENGNVYFFDDVGCMINWKNKQKFKKEVSSFVYVTEITGYIHASLAYYIRDARTPLGYGVEAYGTSMGAMQSGLSSSAIETKFGNFRSKRGSKQIYDFDEIEEYVLRGETLLHPMIKQELLEKN